MEIGSNGDGPVCRVPAAAELAGDKVTPRMLYDWIARGVLPPAVWFRAGRAIYIRRGLFVRWLMGEESTTQPAREEATR